MNESVMTHRGVVPQRVMPDPNAAIKEQAQQLQSTLSDTAVAGLQTDFNKFKHGNISWEEFIVGVKARGSETSGRLYDKFVKEAQTTIAHIDKETQDIINRSKEIGDVRICNRNSNITSMGPADKLFAVMCAVSDFQRKVRRYRDDIAAKSYSGTAELGDKAARPLDISSLSEIIAQLGKDQREIDTIKEFLPSRQEIIDYRRKHAFPANQPLLREADIPKKNKWPADAILTRDVSQELTMKYGFPTTDESVPLRAVTKSTPTTTTTTKASRGKLVAIIIAVVVILIIAVVLYFVFSGALSGGPSPVTGVEKFSARALQINPIDRTRVGRMSARTESVDANGPEMPPTGFDIIEMGRAAGMDMPSMMIEINHANEVKNTNAANENQMNTLMNANGRMDNSRGAKEHFIDCPCGCNDYMS